MKNARNCIHFIHTQIESITFVWLKKRERHNVLIMAWVSVIIYFTFNNLRRHCSCRSLLTEGSGNYMDTMFLCVGLWIDHSFYVGIRDKRIVREYLRNSIRDVLNYKLCLSHILNQIHIAVLFPKIETWKMNQLR